MSAWHRVLVTLLAGALLAGCGFQMRGSTELPEDVRNVQVKGPTVFIDEIEVFIESGGASITEDEEDADAIVRLGREEFHRRVLSVDPEDVPRVDIDDDVRRVQGARLAQAASAADAEVAATPAEQLRALLAQVVEVGRLTEPQASGLPALHARGRRFQHPCAGGIPTADLAARRATEASRC